MLGLIKPEGHEPVRAAQLFAHLKSFVIGIPGAHTPICSDKHVPELVRDAGQLKAAGFDMIGCIASNDPFVLQQWSKEIDPENKVTFISDGNLEFAAALGLLQTEQSLFLGTRSERYSLSIENNLIKRLKVETSIFDVSCTSPGRIISDAREPSSAEVELI
ncbi:MAG: peroxiredoxin [Rhizobiales bacterium]|nr:peroxiredoxin [Hyphomicrobiales bacterium]